MLHINFFFNIYEQKKIYIPNPVSQFLKYKCKKGRNLVEVRRVNKICSLKPTQVLLLKQERKQSHKSRPKIEDVAKT